MIRCTQQQVMTQLSGNQPSRDANCGVHAFKNTLLTLLLNNGCITPQRYQSLLMNKVLFEKIHAAAVTNNIPTEDLLAYNIYELFELLSDGKIDLSEFGITAGHIETIDVLKTGCDQFSIGQLRLDCDFGSTGEETDILAAASLTKFALSKAPSKHVLAVGDQKFSGIGHWVTLHIKKNTQGKYDFETLDCWNNETKFSKGVAEKINKTLSKSNEELSKYLNDAYDSYTIGFNRSYDRYFDENDKLKEEVYWDAAKDYLDERYNQARIAQLLRLNNFFSIVASIEIEEPLSMLSKDKINKVYAVSKFILDNADKTEQKELIKKIKPVVDNLDKLRQQSAQLTTHYVESSADEMDVLDSPVAAMAADNLRPQTTTPSLVSVIIGYINDLWQNIVNGVTSIVENITTAISVR